MGKGFFGGSSMLARLAIVVLGCGCVLCEATAQEKATDIGELRVFLCTLSYEIPWRKRTVQPRDYQDSFQQHWVEIYLPAHKVAWKLGTEDFLLTDEKRYQGGKPVVFDLRLPSKETIDHLWRDHSPTKAQVVTELTLAAKTRQEVERKLTGYLKMNAERLPALRKALQQEIVQQIEKSKDLYKDDARFKLGDTADTVLEQVKSAGYLPLRRVGSLHLHHWRNEEKVVRTLVSLLSDEDEYVAFDAAQTLALAGRREAIPVLRKTLAGEMAVSNSEFERDRAALALLALGEKLPKTFVWREHPELEKYIERE
jgi:hypothetical protein